MPTFRRTLFLAALLLQLAAFLGYHATAAETGIASATTEKAAKKQKAELAPLAVHALAGDLTGGFAGTSNGCLLVGIVDGVDGDCALHSFPLAAQGSTEWQASDVHVPAWSAVAQWNQTLVCAGGFSHGAFSDQVVQILIQDGKINCTTLAKLPTPLAGAGAAVVGNKLFVFGGMSSVSPPALKNSLWTLDLDNPSAQWQSAPPLPGAGRAFSSVTQQYDTVCVMGGLVAGPAGTQSLEGTSETWIFKSHHWEASGISGWQRMQDAPRPLLGAAAFPAGQASVVVVGKLDLPQGGIWPVESGTSAGQDPLLFNVVTDAWCEFDAPTGFASTQAARQTTRFGTQLYLLGNGSGASPIQVDEFKILRTAQSLSWLDYLVVVCYFSFISLIGVIASRHQKSSADFSLAGRHVPWWVAGISMYATGASAISFMAIPALAFSTNLVFLTPILLLAVPIFLVQSRLIYPLLRRMEITSTYEYLERRFNKALRMIASVQCIIFQTFGRASVVLVLPSLAISATTGLNVYLCLVLMWFITTVYTVAGGFHAVVWTDLFQGILKFVAPLSMIGICIFSLPGGFHEFVQIGMAHHKFDYAMVTSDYTVPAIWIVLTNTFLATTIQTAGDQPVIQRVFSSPEKDVRRVAAMQVACGCLIATVVNVLGIAIYAYFQTHPAELDPLVQNDKIVPLFVIQALPHGVVGMIIAAIFASAMTTVASSMNSSATVFTEDFFLRFRPNASDKQRVLVLRLGSILVGLVALSIALLLVTLNLKSLMVTWSIISALLGGGIVGVYSLGMFTRRANGFGAVTGAILSIIITSWIQFATPVHWLALTPIAIISCMVLGYLFSLLTPQKKDLKGLTIYKDGPVELPMPSLIHQD